MSSHLWRNVLLIALVVLVLVLLTAGFIVPLLGILLLALALFGGALLYRTQGPPDR